MTTRKKIALSLLSIGLLTVGSLYLSGVDLQGKFTLNTKMQQDNQDNNDSPVLLEVSAATNGSIFLQKPEADVYASVSPLSEFSITPVKKSDILKSCEFSFSSYFDGELILLSEEAEEIYLHQISMSARNSKSVVATESQVDDGDSLYSPLLTFDRVLAKNDAITLDVSGNPSEKNSLSAKMGELDTYDANSVDLYMTEMSCIYKTDDGKFNEEYTWDVSNSQDENKYFKIPTSVQNRGLFMTTMILGN